MRARTRSFLRVMESPGPESVDTGERRVKLTLQYDGAGFAGWQVQPGRRTVQGELEAALSRLADRPVTVIGAGRTDRGVHATGQVASAVLSAKWQPRALHRALDALLPADVWVAAIADVPLSFHARYDAVARGYVYRVGARPEARSPFLRRWCWPVRGALAPQSLADAAARFVGEKSFRAFAKAGQPERGERCTVLRSEWRPWRRVGFEYRVVANRFLHHMVRYMVGTMVDVARGRRPADEIDALLRGDGGLETSPPAPPEGLFLTRVFYDATQLDDEELDEVLS
jgi:tRNA pseudouridine38-40 synthase